MAPGDRRNEEVESFLASFARHLPVPEPDRRNMVATLRDHLEAAAEAGRLPATLAALGSPEEIAGKMLAGGHGRHRHLDRVELPDGTSVYAASFRRDDYQRDLVPHFGLYLDPQWQPPWPHVHVDWPDFGVPTDRGVMITALREALDRARRGELVEVGCLGGHGRTGVALALLAVLAGLTGDPVAWVRETYCPDAIETDEQVAVARSLR